MSEAIWKILCLWIIITIFWGIGKFIWLGGTTPPEDSFFKVGKVSNNFEILYVEE